MNREPRFVIPKCIKLPGGYKIKINTLGLKRYRAKNGGTKAICYFNDCIDLRADRNPSQRRADFLHEMGHVILDWQCRSFERTDVDPKT